MAIIDETNRYIAHTAEGFVLEQRYENRVFGGDDECLRFRDEGTRWVAHSTAIPGTPWKVVYYRNADAAFSLLPSVLSIVGLVTMVCLGIALAIGSWLRRSAKTVLATYIRQVGAIASGRYDLRIHSEFSEFDILSTGIETMASAVSCREAELRAAVAEREALLKEVHHRVKNNLQIVASLLNLELHTLPDPVTAAAFVSSMDRIRSMGLIHETLYGQENLSSVAFDDYARRLIGDLRSVYGKAGVTLTQDLAHVLISLDQAMPCGLILNELITNAFKYGVADRSTAELLVRLGVSGDDIELSVSDDGPGLPDDLDSGAIKGLGLRLIRTLASQLDGTVSWEPRPAGSGLKAMLRFRLAKEPVAGEPVR